MKWPLASLAALSIIASTHVAYAQSKPDFGHLDGVPLDGSEEQIIDIFERISPPPPAKVSTNGRRPLFDPTEGMTPIEVRANNYGGQRAPCAPIGGSASSQQFEKSMGVHDRAVGIAVSFKEIEPDRSCATIATYMTSDQVIEGSTVEAQEASEDEFFKAAVKAYGKPTIFSPRHIGNVVNNHQSENMLGTFNNIIGAGNNAPQGPTTEKAVIGPFAIWCDTGTLGDCRSGGPTVNRRLLMRLNLFNDRPYMELQLEDLKAERRIDKTIARSSAEHTKPQLFEQSKPASASSFGKRPADSADASASVGSRAKAIGSNVDHPTPHFTVVNAWVDRSPTSYYFHDTLEIAGGSTGATINPAMFVLPVALAGNLSSDVPAMTVAAPKFARFDPSTNAQKLVPTVDPTQDLGALGTVSIAPNVTAKVTVTFRVEGSPANPEGTRDERNVKLRDSNERD